MAVIEQKRPLGQRRAITFPTHLQPPPCRLTVVVAVDQLNTAVISAVRYAELLRPTRLNGLHVDLDQEATSRLAQAWNEKFGGRVPLVVVDPAGRSLADTVARSVVDDLPDPNHPVVVIVPSTWAPTADSPSGNRHIVDVAARLANIDHVVLFVAPALMEADAAGPGPQEYGDRDIEDAVQWAMARHEMRRSGGIPPSSR
jgi:hypothetical protein